ncbi:MAG: [Fe-Fe] hydrogenase large subunit C-terminal domain-containing protein [Actinomycetota bacterium]|nr:[Fe-Fe] hydrogenase large subunit C-terminal domain-containing protein [Actinomycetota bacterium]
MGEDLIELIETDPKNCVACLSCLRACPVNCIAVRGNLLEINHLSCIYCGRCLSACPRGALKAKGSIKRLRRLLKEKDKVAAILAPEYLAAFYPYGSTEVAAGLIKLGFEVVEGTLLGEEVVAAEYERLLAEADGMALIRSTCPVVVSLIEKHHPDLIAHLAPVVSPMIAAGRLVKAIKKNHATVYITPCIAHKAERRDPSLKNSIDLVITFDELKVIFQEEEIDLSELSVAKIDPIERIFRVKSMPGGLPKDVLKRENFTSTAFRVADDIYETKRYVKAAEVTFKGLGFLDARACSGCLNSPVFKVDRDDLLRLTQLKSLIKRAYLKERKKIAWPDPTEVISKLPWIMRKRVFTEREALAPYLVGEDHDEVLIRAGLLDEEFGAIDCSCCGYDSCRELFAAVDIGLASLDNCYMHRTKRTPGWREDSFDSGRRDYLTGLLERESLLEQLEFELKRSNRYGFDLSLIAIDLDHFTLINEAYGRIYSDEILKEVAKGLGGDLRSSDIAAREGEDNFILVLPGTNKTRAFALAEKLRKKIEGSRFVYGNFRIPVTVSMGVASNAPGQGSSAKILDLARAALIRAKEEGRNVVYLAPSAPEGQVRSNSKNPE